MIELNCKRCDTGIFRVEDIARGLGKLPLRITCHICGIQYMVKLDENDSPAVFYRQGRVRWRKMEIAGLKEIEPVGDEVVEEVEEKPAEEAAGVEIKAEGPTEDQPEQVAAEESEGTEDLSAEEKEEPREAEATE